ncbi:MAG: TonB-dependent receptor [Cytophagales bacterium]|nr:MAG: TonB-dependent receptor [Cytophagales bacterium]
MKFRNLLIFLNLWLCTASLYAQVTTASMSGVITDEKGEALIGATVVAKHLPSGSQYGAATNNDGRFTIPNMRVGSPYEVVVSYIGFKSEKFEGISLQLGQKFVLNAKLRGENTTLEAVSVTADASMNSSRTGAAMNIDNSQLQNLPTISRSAADYTRLTPLAAEGGSFGGRNSQYNNYSLDGAIFNNPFGLDAATPGGQTDAQAVSLDAIDQIQVSVAPYDVTQAGFTGAAINAVTKSGTNKFTGTVFAFYRNKDMIGTKVKDAEVFRGDLSALQTGFAIGGAIIKDKLFFFANFELERRSDLGSNFVANRGSSGANVSRVLASDLDNISNLFRSVHGYETGVYENYKHNTNNQKGIFKLDWNISQNHKLSATVNFLDAFKDKPANPTAIGRRGPDAITLQYYNSGYRINNQIFGSVIDLKSQFGSKYSNKLQVGYTQFNDTRDPFSSPFPVVNFSKDGVRYIVAGHEPFSINNRLNQYVFQITNNFNIYAGKHTLTFGTSLERFSFKNSFNLTGYGARVFFPDVPMSEAESFIRSKGFADEVAGARAAFNNNNAKGTWALAETTLGQWAIYGQDEYAASDKLTLTYGLRVDVPLYFNTAQRVEENIARNGGLLSAGGVYAPDIQYFNGDAQPTKLSSTTLPSQKPLFSPRIGFNYDVKGDRTQQLRGGSGLFTGRFPFVWIGNQVANPAFFFYCVTDPNFKFPQVWRTNLGYDHKFKNGVTVSADVIYTKDVNAVMVQNWGLKTPTARLQGDDNRPVYQNSDRSQIFGGATNAYVFTNNNLGSTLNIQLQAEKAWKNGLYIKGGYNFLDAKDGASTTVEISSDVFDLNPSDVQNSNRPILGPAPFGNRHRFIGVLAKKFTYGGGKWATNIAVFSEYVQGNRYSFTYSGDINNDGGFNNDLMFVPTDAQISQMRFSGDAAQQNAQRTAFRTFIAQDDYLSSRRGQYAEKFASLNPWYSKWDMRILQDYKLPNGNTIQLSLDILNFGNLISSSWGTRQIASTTRLVQPLGVSVDDKNVPTYSFDANRTNTFFNDFTLNSRWQMQIGLRYRF